MRSPHRREFLTARCEREVRVQHRIQQGDPLGPNAGSDRSTEELVSEFGERAVGNRHQMPSLHAGEFLHVECIGIGMDDLPNDRCVEQDPLTV